MSTSYRSRCLSEKGEECALCGATENIVAHHISGNRADNRIENLLPVCRSCHGAIHDNTEPKGRIKELQEQLIYEGGPTTIQISNENHRRLRERKTVDGETFDSVVGRLLNDTADEDG